MTTPQQEHAARQRERARRIFRDELAALGIATDKHVERAVVRLASGFVLTIEPRHFGSSVDIMPFLPRDLAREVNDTPCDCFGGGYSDDNGRLGAVARPHGHAGGLANHNLRTYQRGAPVSTWHCDSIGALGTLLRVVARTITADGLTADAALLDEKRRWTDEILASAEKHLASGGPTDAVFEALRDALHEHRLALADDPRVVAFRAAHPRTVSR